MKKNEISSCKQIVLFLIHKYSTSTLVLGKKKSDHIFWRKAVSREKSKIAHLN